MTHWYSFLTVIDSKDKTLFWKLVNASLGEAKNILKIRVSKEEKKNHYTRLFAPCPTSVNSPINLNPTATC